MKIHSSPKRAPDRQQDAKQHSPSTPNAPARPAQHRGTALRPMRIHMTPAGDRRAPLAPESAAPPEPSEAQPIAFTPAPANTPPEPTQEQALKALDTFKLEERYPAYEVSAGQPRREGWIKRGEAGGVALMAINNSYARQAHEPRIQHLYWPDENAFAAQLYGSLREGKNCPHPKPGQAPDIDAMLKHLQQCHTPLETFLVWCCVLTDPQTVDIRPAAAQPASSAQTQDTPVLAPDEQRRLDRQRVNPVRLVDRVSAPLAWAVACPELLRNIAGRSEEWAVLDSGQSRARLELQQMRICVDLGQQRDALFIWLSPDRTRVIDITGHPLSASWGSAQCPPPGLLRDNFVRAAQPARALLINGSTSQLSRLPTVTPFDVDALGDTADSAQGLARMPIPWDASEADMQLPRSLGS
ncbi:MAG: hypothetical protein H7346_12800 [Burkholderiaceae bacterium]|nr:hypothetical protein [Burkholderiaceae bacterium]